MQTKAEFFSRCGRNGVRLAGLALGAVLLAACTPSAGRKSGLPATAAVQPTLPVAAVEPTPPAYSAASPAPAPAPKAPAAGETVVRMLAYADRVRAMSSGELNQEAARLSPVQSPTEQMRLALVLSQSRQTAEVIRSQELLTRLLANVSAEAEPLHPLARLLAARLGEQRRFEDLLDRHSQLARDLQRRLDQTLERLEALKAIERSMTRRPVGPSTTTTPATPATAATPAPASRARTPASAP